MRSSEFSTSFSRCTDMNALCILFVLFFVAGAIASPRDDCHKCGNECEKSCGTRSFRTCCFNYMRKRSVPLSVVLDPNMRLELWSAKSRRSLFEEARRDDNSMNEEALY